MKGNVPELVHTDKHVSLDGAAARQVDLIGLSGFREVVCGELVAVEAGMVADPGG
jgi:hypothetical protein